MTKPGIRTTEFAVTVLAIVGQLAAALAGQLAPSWAAVATSVEVLAYSLSRAIVKSPSSSQAKPSPADAAPAPVAAAAPPAS